MLQLPEKDVASRKRPRAKRSIGAKTDRHNKDAAAHRRLCDLECSISNAKTMSSVLSVLADKLAREVIAYRDASPAFTAARMAQDIEDDVESVLYVAYEVERMVRDLEQQYLAPLDDEEGSL